MRKLMETFRAMLRSTTKHPSGREEQTTEATSEPSPAPKTEHGERAKRATIDRFAAQNSYFSAQNAYFSAQNAYFGARKSNAAINAHMAAYPQYDWVEDKVVELFGYGEEWWVMATTYYDAKHDTCTRLASDRVFSYQNFIGSVSQSQSQSDFLEELDVLQKVMTFWEERPGEAELLLPGKTRHSSVVTTQAVNSVMGQMLSNAGMKQWK